MYTTSSSSHFWYIRGLLWFLAKLFCENAENRLLLLQLDLQDLASQDKDAYGDG